MRPVGDGSSKARSAAGPSGGTLTGWKCAMRTLEASPEFVHVTNNTMFQHHFFVVVEENEK